MTVDAPGPRDIGAYYDRFWSESSADRQREHDFGAFQAAADGALAWAIADGGGVAGRTVLEVGPGLGRDSERFARAGARVVAIDVSSTALARAQERLAAIGLGGSLLAAVADAAHLPIRDAAIDVTFNRFTIAHLDAEAYGAELARVLRPGGRALMVEPLRGNPFVRLYRRFASTGCRETAPRYLTLGDLRRLAARFPRGWRHRELYLFSVLALGLRGTRLHRPVAALLRALESPLESLGPLRRLCWVAVVELRR